MKQIAKERLKESLRAHRNVVWDATGLRADFRALPVSIGYDYGAFTEIVVFQTHPEDAKRNNRNRAHRVPEAVIDAQYESAQMPYADEAHRVTFLPPTNWKQ